jgi:hypothetical protein
MNMTMMEMMKQDRHRKNQHDTILKPLWFSHRQHTVQTDHSAWEYTASP